MKGYLYFVFLFCLMGSAFAQDRTFGEMMTESDYFKDADQLEIPRNGLYGKIPQAVQEKLPRYKQKFCARTEWDIHENAIERSNLISFRNPGGFFKTGLCWWYSRLLRSSLYLAKFLPHLKRPTKEQARRIILNLKDMDRVVTIQGFDNFYDFSYAYRHEMEDILSVWQIEDALKIEPLINAITGSTHEKAIALRARMDSLYDRLLHKKQLVWQLLQTPGIGTHAWLVVEMSPLRSEDPTNRLGIDGYKLGVLDSNLPKGLQYVYYYFGDLTVLLNRTIPMIPYTDYDSDLDKIEDTILDYCSVK